MPVLLFERSLRRPPARRRRHPQHFLSPADLAAASARRLTARLSQAHELLRVATHDGMRPTLDRSVALQICDRHLKICLLSSQAAVSRPTKWPRSRGAPTSFLHLGSIKVTRLDHRIFVLRGPWSGSHHLHREMIAFHERTPSCTTKKKPRYIITCVSRGPNLHVQHEHEHEHEHDICTCANHKTSQSSPAPRS